MNKRDVLKLIATSLNYRDGLRTVEILDGVIAIDEDNGGAFIIRLQEFPVPVDTTQVPLPEVGFAPPQPEKLTDDDIPF